MSTLWKKFVKPVGYDDNHIVDICGLQIPIGPKTEIYFFNEKTRRWNNAKSYKYNSGYSAAHFIVYPNGRPKHNFYGALENPCIIKCTDDEMYNLVKCHFMLDLVLRNCEIFGDIEKKEIHFAYQDPNKYLHEDIYISFEDVLKFREAWNKNKQLESSAEFYTIRYGKTKEEKGD